jgi:hypothetical protein
VFADDLPATHHTIRSAGARPVAISATCAVAVERNSDSA